MPDAWGLVFDIDGVVANTEPLAIQATHTVFHNLNGATIDPADIMEYMGSTAAAYFTALGGKYAPEASLQKLIKDHNRLLLRELRNARDLIFPGVRSLFVRAGSDGSCRLAFATGSGRKRSEATIAACSLPTDTLRAWLTGDDIERPKPDPEIYTKTVTALGIPAGRCVAIEDSIAGVESAKSAGMKCVAVTNTFPAEQLQSADSVVESLEEVNVESLRSML